MSSPERSLWATKVLSLVSGYPRDVRIRRPLLMLQAFIDESYTDGAVFVMAGYIATVDKWMAFSDEWASLLGLGPPYFRRISEFHMTEMKSQVAIEQSELFYRVIERHVDAHVTFSLRFSDLHAAYDSISWPSFISSTEHLRNEYYHGFHGITTGLPLLQEKMGFTGPIDLIFDEHTKKIRCLKAWDAIKRLAPPDITRNLGSTPIFRSSEETMPLQAADMLAYWVREGQLATGKLGAFQTAVFPWAKKRKITGLHLFHTREKLERNFRNTILACSLARYNVSAKVIRKILAPDGFGEPGPLPGPF